MRPPPAATRTGPGPRVGSGCGRSLGERPRSPPVPFSQARTGKTRSRGAPGVRASSAVRGARSLPPAVGPVPARPRDAPPPPVPSGSFPLSPRRRTAPKKFARGRRSKLRPRATTPPAPDPGPPGGRGQRPRHPWETRTPPGSAPLPERGAWERAAARSREPWEGFWGGRRDFFFSVVCRRGRGMSCCFQVPGAGRPARGEPPGSLCRGCAWQARPGCSLGSGRLRARHVGFTTAQNTSVRVWCGVHGGEGGEGEGSHQRAGAQGPFFGNIPHFVPPLNF